jgi:hypothetical protein
LPYSKAQAGRLGGLTTSLRHDPLVTSLPGRHAAEERYGKQVDEEHPGLPAAERQRRIEVARKLHYVTMARRSVESRKAKASRVLVGSDA